MDWTHHLPFHMTGPLPAAATLGTTTNTNTMMDDHHHLNSFLAIAPPLLPTHTAPGGGMEQQQQQQQQNEEISLVRHQAQMLQEENIRLQQQLQHVQRELQDRDGQIVTLQHRIDELLLATSNLPPPAIGRPDCDDDQAAAGRQLTTANNKLPVYGRNDHPLVTERSGLVDGRSNADMAFEQKCQLLDEYRRIHGHVNVKMTDDPHYAAPLVPFIIKQRNYYRHYRNGELKSSVNMERIRRLENLGFEWSRRPDYEAEFVKCYDQLVKFQQQYGHCCVNARPTTTTTASSSSDNNDLQELVKFVARQRKYWKYTKEMEHWQQQNQLSATRSDDADTSVADINSDDNNDSGDEAEPATDPIDLAAAGEEVEDGGDGAPTTAPRIKKPRRFLIPKHYTKSMQERIESLDDPFLTTDLNEVAPLADQVAKHCRSIRFLKQTKSYHPNTVGWYQRFEEFRTFYNDHGHGFVPLNTTTASSSNSSTTTTTTSAKRDNGLKHFVRVERALQQAIQLGTIEAHPLFVRNIQFLKDHGFVYDEVAIQREEERLRALEVKQKREEMYYATPRGQLELMEKDAAVAKQRLQAAQDAKKAAEEAWSEVHRDYLKVKKKIREAAEKASHDPVGSIVHVRDRGPGKPGGKAKVTRYSVTKVLNEVVKFYDVVYLDNDEREDTFIEGRFVDDAKTVAALLDLGKESDDDTDEREPSQGIMTRNKRKAITQAKQPTTTTTTQAPATAVVVVDEIRPAKTRRLIDLQQREPPPHSMVAAPPYPIVLPQPSAAKFSVKRHPALATKMKVLTKSTSKASNSVPIQPVQTIPTGPSLMGVKTKTIATKVHVVYSQLEDGQTPREAPTETIEEIPTPPQSLPVITKPPVTTTGTPVKPKHPVGSLVNVRWRGEQKPGGVGKVINFFTTKVLSEILPFYEVEYVKDKSRDTCIEGRFIEEYENLEVLRHDDVTMTNGPIIVEPSNETDPLIVAQQADI